MSMWPHHPGPGLSDTEQPIANGWIDPGLLSVDVATAVLRRGVPVVVSNGPDDTILVVALEAAPADASALLRALCGVRPRLLWSRPRDGFLERLSDDAADDLGAVRSVLGLDRRADWDWEDATEPLSASSGAAVRLAKLAGLLPAVLAAPLSAAAADGRGWESDRQIPQVRAKDVALYQDQAAATLRPVSQAVVPLSDAEVARLVAFRPASGGLEHIAVIVGQPQVGAPVLARLHSACLTGDLLASLRCDCGDQLRGAIAAMARVGGGVLLYLAQEGRGIGLVNKLRAYELQDRGLDTIDANRELGFEADERVYRAAAEMLRQLGFDRVRLLTNNPEKVAALARYDIDVVERVAHAFPANAHNAGYLRTKALRAGHALPLEGGEAANGETPGRLAHDHTQERAW